LDGLISASFHLFIPFIEVIPFVEAFLAKMRVFSFLFFIVPYLATTAFADKGSKGYQAVWTYLAYCVDWDYSLAENIPLEIGPYCGTGDRMCTFYEFLESILIDQHKGRPSLKIPRYNTYKPGMAEAEALSADSTFHGVFDPASIFEDPPASPKYGDTLLAIYEPVGRARQAMGTSSAALNTHWADMDLLLEAMFSFRVASNAGPMRTHLSQALGIADIPTIRAELPGGSSFQEVDFPKLLSREEDIWSRTNQALAGFDELKSTKTHAAVLDAIMTIRRRMASGC
jgi:hypothetical protein